MPPVATSNVNIPVAAGSTALSLATRHGHTRIRRIVTIIHNCLNPCTVCNKYGHDATGRLINAENKLKAAAKMKSDAEAILQSKKSNKKAYVASSAAKESDASSCNCISLKCYRACANTYAMPSSRFHARSAVLDQVFVPDTTTSILDSGAMASIIQGTQGTGCRVQLVGVTGNGIQAEIADVTFPVLTATNELSLGARGYRTSRRVKRHGSQKQGSPPVAGDAARPSELPQENQDVLKKLREMKLGAHNDHALSSSSADLGKSII